MLNPLSDSILPLPIRLKVSNAALKMAAAEVVYETLKIKLVRAKNTNGYHPTVHQEATEAGRDFFDAKREYQEVLAELVALTTTTERIPIIPSW